MARKTALVIVRGRRHEWCIVTDVPASQITEMRDDGLVVHEQMYAIPALVVQAGLAPIWACVANIFHLRFLPQRWWW